MSDPITLGNYHDERWAKVWRGDTMTPPQRRRAARQLLMNAEAISTESRQLLREFDGTIEDEIAISTALYDGLASVRWACAKLAGKDAREMLPEAPQEP